LRPISAVLYIFLFSLCANVLTAQSQLLQNPSFEDEPADATMPMGWFACQEGTTPDILPGYWGVFLEASEGDTYVGLITRGNGTYESIGQRLPKKLQKNGCYEVSFDVAHSQNYSGYSKPVKVRVWLGDKKCRKDQMIFESDFIENEEWESIDIKFDAKSNSRYIFFEAYYKESNFDHKGNVLIDNLSAIRYCNRA